MEAEQIISWLRDHAKEADPTWRRVMLAAADKLEEQESICKDFTPAVEQARKYREQMAAAVGDMSICKTCGNTRCRNKQPPNEITVFCSGYIKPPTNSDRIRDMSNMGIAKLLTQAVANGCPPDMDWDCKKDDGGWEACDKCWCKWLQQPAEEVSQ